MSARVPSSAAGSASDARNIHLDAQQLTQLGDDCSQIEQRHFLLWIDERVQVTVLGVLAVYNGAEHPGFPAR